MKIAIDTSPLTTGHKVRGVGFYLEHLKKALLDNYPKQKFLFFQGKDNEPKDADIVHYPYFDPFQFTLPFRKTHKTIVTIHDLIPLVFPQHFPAGLKGNLRWMLQKQLLKNVDAIITDSESSKKDIVRLTGIPEEKVLVVYLAAADDYKRDKIYDLRFKKLQQKYSLPEKYLLYVGDVTWNKNLPRLIEAVKKINVTIVMVGKALANEDYDKNNPWNKDLVEVQKATENDKRIIKPGFIPNEELNVLYAHAAALIMPSRYEGFGLPVLEAMQAGCPVITTKQGSLPEVAGDAAFYVDYNDTDSIANGIGEVFYSEKLRSELSKKGVEHAKKFSWEKTAFETYKVYEKVFNT